MTAFYILGALGVCLLLHQILWDRAAKAAFKRGFQAGKEVGRLEADLCWSGQDGPAQVRDAMWKELP